ncbi:GNAT family N-acetyltransferase [Jeotgalibaca sp. A127]|uniref:GNAT family N-acetyltransferase n=1 Tax=Jeotgalibaca sp. A127 TaxID=3457324 RepID=UPI003FD0F786
MQVVPVTTTEQFRQIEMLYLTAFPENERKSFSMMKDLMADGSVEMVIFSTNEFPFVGFAISAIHDQTVLVDYLAIHPDYRGMGFGSMALKWLLNHYQAFKVCLEIESTKVDAENKRERQLRKGFYLKNALELLAYEAEVFGVRFEILANDKSLVADEYVAVYHNVYGERSSRNVAILTS